MLLVAGPLASASAAEPALYDGALQFSTIHRPSEPEDFTWSVGLEPGQELREIDEHAAAVFYKNGTQAMFIADPRASDASGANVPTTLAVTEPDLVTLTVHHQAGNPLAGGAPFEYPVLPGPAFVTGPVTVTVEMLPEGAVAQAMREIERAGPAAVIQPPPIHHRAAPDPRVLVTRALGDPRLFYRPHTFLLSGDGTFGMDEVQWKSYGGGTATASARAFVNDCVPYCAAGHLVHPRAKLRLSKVVDCNGKSIYARLDYRLFGKLPASFPRRGGYPMRPLGEDGKPDC